MCKDKLVKIKVNDLRTHYKLSNVTLDNLIYIIEDQGFEIIEFTTCEESSSNHLLREFNLMNYAMAGKAFTYQCGSAKFIFVCEDMSVDEKLYALAHEVGHIFCFHLQEGNVNHSVEEEYEANEFAHHLLHPSVFASVKRWLLDHKTGIVVVISIALILCVGIIMILQINKNSLYYGEYYITESGKKYHKEDCIFVKNKKNVERLTESQFNLREYEACQICLPN